MCRLTVRVSKSKAFNLVRGRLQHVTLTVKHRPHSRPPELSNDVVSVGHFVSHMSPQFAAA